jgi:uncharacterized repeat protein (TIGR01451 family)
MVRPRVRPAIEQLEDRRLLSLSPTTWTGIGPGPILGSPYTASGRVNVAVPDPNNPNVMFVGTPDGGIWRTDNWTDTTPTWTPLTDAQSSLAIPQHGLALFPGSGSNPATLYAEASGPNGVILKTTDGGHTWAPSQAASSFTDAIFSAIALSPTDPQTLYVAVSGDDGAGTTVGGLYRSTDGGQTFANLSVTQIGGAFATDVVVDPNDPTILYVGVVNATDTTKNGVYQVQLHADGSSTWTQANDGVITAGANVGIFIRLAVGSDKTVSPAQTVVYATIYDPSNGVGTPSLERFRAEGGIASWVKLNLPPSGSDNRTNHVVLAVDPSNPNVIYANGAEPHFIQGTYDPVMKKVAWVSLIPEYPNMGTEDIADATFDDSGRVIMEGDRGIGLASSSPPTAGTFLAKQGNLSTELIYKLAIDPTNPAIGFSVAQDQAVSKYTDSPVWNDAGTGNEIGTVLIDPGNPNTVYNLSPATFLTRSDSGGVPGSWSDISSGANASDFPSTAKNDESFYTALALDPNHTSTLVLGSFLVYQTTTGGLPPSPGANAWAPISPSLTGASDSQISAIAVAPSDGTIYAATLDGQMFVSPAMPNGTTAWPTFDMGLPVVGGNHVVEIVVDPNDSGHLFVVTSGANSKFNRVWEKTTTTNWTSITGNLPTTLHVYTIAPDWRFTTPVLYVGTDRGAFRSTDEGTSWSLFDAGLPNTLVRDLHLLPQTQGGVLAAGTTGRGAFEISVPAAPTLTISGPATASEGDTLTYTVTIRNDTPSGASGVTFTATLPPGLRFVSENFGTNVATFANGTVTVPVGTLASGSSVTGTITVLATTDGAMVSQGNLAYTLPVTSPTAVTTTASTTVIEPPIVGSGMPMQGLEGSSLGTVTLASFTHANGLQPASAFAVSIAWGDGSTSAGTVTQSGATYSVQGSHTYTDEGNYPVTVTVTEDGSTATIGTSATILSVLPDGTRGTANERFVAEAFGDLFGQPPTPPQLAKYSNKLKANHGKFVTTLLTGAFQHRFLANEASLLYMALVGMPPTPHQITQAVSGLQGGKSLLQVARKWPGVSSATEEALLVQALVEQFLDRPSSAGDVALYGHFVAHPGKMDDLAAALVGGAEYFAKTTP